MARKGVQVAERDFVALEDKTKNALATSITLQNVLQSHHLTCEDDYAFTVIPPDDECEKLLTLIRRYFNHFGDMTPMVPTHIKEFVRLKDSSAGARFNLFIEDESKKTYAKLLMRFVFCVDRLYLSNKPPVSITTGIGECAQQLVSGNEVNGASGLIRLHQFFKALLLVEVKASSGERVMVEDIFCVIPSSYEMGRYGRLRVAEADDASHIFAALQYTLHVCAIGEFLETPLGFGPKRTGSTDAEALRNIGRLTSTASSTPAAYIRLMRHKTMAIADAEMPRILFALCHRHSRPCGVLGSLEVPGNGEQGSLGFAVRSLQTETASILREDILQVSNSLEGFGRILGCFMITRGTKKQVTTSESTRTINRRF